MEYTSQAEGETPPSCSAKFWDKETPARGLIHPPALKALSSELILTVVLILFSSAVTVSSWDGVSDLCQPSRGSPQDQLSAPLPENIIEICEQREGSSSVK